MLLDYFATLPSDRPDQDLRAPVPPVVARAKAHCRLRQKLMVKRLARHQVLNNYPTAEKFREPITVRG